MRGNSEVMRIWGERRNSPGLRYREIERERFREREREKREQNLVSDEDRGVK